MTRRLRRPAALAALLSAAALAPFAGCTTATVKRVSATPTPTGTPLPTATHSPTSTATVTPLGVAMTCFVKTKNEMGSVRAYFLCDVYDRLTLADVNPALIGVTPPAGVSFYVQGQNTPAPVLYTTPVNLPTTAQLTSQTGRFDSLGRQDGLFEIPLLVGQTYGFRGQSVTQGAFSAAGAVQRILAPASPMLVTPAAPSPFAPVTLSWGAVTDAQAYLVWAIEPALPYLWPATGPMRTTATSVTITGGLPAGYYFYLVWASDDPLTVPIPLEVTNHSLAYRTFTVQ